MASGAAAVIVVRVTTEVERHGQATTETLSRMAPIRKTWYSERRAEIRFSRGLSDTDDFAAPDEGLAPEAEGGRRGGTNFGGPGGRATGR